MFKRYVFSEGLTNLRGSNGKYLINIFGQVKDEYGNNLEPGKDGDGNITVFCLGWAGERLYRVIDLVAIQYKSLRIPESDFDKVIAFTIDDNPENTRADNVGYRFKGGKLEHAFFPGYYYVPGFTDVIIDIFGNTRRSKDGYLKKYHSMKPNEKFNGTGGYMKTSVIFEKGLAVNLFCHRALCLVFKEYPNNADYYNINHKDGNPKNNNLDNLEWTTPSENIKHAHEHELIPNHRRVLIRNVFTGEVKEYYSLSEASKALGYTSQTGLKNRLNPKKFGNVYSDGTQVKFKDDSRDWVIPENAEESVAKAFKRTQVVSRNFKTGEIQTHVNVLQASKFTNVGVSCINLRLKNSDHGLYNGFQFKTVEDTREWKNFTFQDYQNSFELGSKTVEARNLITKEEKVFASIREAARELNYPSLRDFVTRVNQPLLDNGWQLKIGFGEWEDIDNFEEILYKRQRTVVAKCEKTNKIYIANDALQLSQLLGIRSSDIRKAAFTRGNTVCKGFRFRLGVLQEEWPETKISL